MDSSGSTKLLSGGAVASALAASVCCFGPLVLALLGVGGGAVLLKLEPYRPYALGVAALFLAGGFYLAYRPPREDECASGSACALSPSRKGQRTTLWIVAVITALAAAFPYYSKYLF